MEVKDLMAHRPVVLGRYVAYWLNRSPRRALHSMSYYKFAAKMIGSSKRVLDVGCGEGLGTWLLAAECGYARGLDFDQQSIETARGNWDDPRIAFGSENFLETDMGTWDALVSFDVVEHIQPANVAAFWERTAACLAHDGVAIVGTPNITSTPYASPIAHLGRSNLYSGERLETEMRRYFEHVFMFAGNDEVVHTGYLPMAHYLISVGCRKRG